MTAKEALERIKNRFGTWAINHIKEFEVLEQALTELEELKATPTEQEVCEALSKQLKTPIKIGKNKHGITFNYVNTGKTLVSVNYDLINITIQLPPHFIELVAKFYKGDRK